MTDAKAWIEERRTIHRDGWSGKWSWSLNDRDLATLRATGGHVDFDLIRDDEFRGPSEVLDEIVDAHNVTVPRALNALEQVLELIEFMETDAESYLNAGHRDASDVLLEAAGDLRQAIKGAINE